MSSSFLRSSADAYRWKGDLKVDRERQGLTPFLGFALRSETVVGLDDGGWVVLYVTPSTDDANRVVEALDIFLRDPTRPASLSVTLGSPWRRASATLLLLTMALPVVHWVLRRTRVVVDERRGLVSVERLQWPLPRETHMIPCGTLRDVVIEGISGGGVRLALSTGSSMLVSLPDFRPTLARAARQRELLHAFLFR